MLKFLKTVFYWITGTVAVIALALATGCVNLALPLVDETGGRVPEPFPPVLEGIETADDWQARRDALRASFINEVYGAWPNTPPIALISRATIDPSAFGGKAIIEQFEFSFTLETGTITQAVTVATPLNVEGPVPLFLSQTFCGSHTAFGREDVPPPNAPYPGFCDGGFFSTLIGEYIFGRHIGTKPVEDFIDQGVAFASYYPGELVPDDEVAGLDALNTVFANYEPRPGAIGIWAWSFEKIAAYFDTEPAFAPDQTIAYGHSRHGKAALVAGAFGDSIDMVISHQSGRGGTALSRSGIGESVGQITESYPHWFTPAYAGFSDSLAELTFDQHVLIAMVAPKPLLIGNARRDRWSDPGSAWKAAGAADAIYELLGADGVSQPNMATHSVSDDVVFYLRNGRHGQTTKDFKTFLNFIEAHTTPIARRGALVHEASVALWANQFACQTVNSKLCDNLVMLKLDKSPGSTSQIALI